MMESLKLLYSILKYLLTFLCPIGRAYIFCSNKGEKRIRNEKPHKTHRIHSSRATRWSRALDCGFSLFNHHIYIKCHWKFDHHHSHLGGLPSTDTYVFFPQELLHIRNFLYNGSVAQLSPGTKWFHTIVQLNCFS